MNKRIVKETISGYIWTMPVILGICIFTFYPVIQSFIYSFYDYNGLNTVEFIGFENYIEIFKYDFEMGKVVSNTLIYASCSVVINLVLGYLLALLVNIKLPGIGIFRVLFYLPVIIPGVASSLLWKDMFDANYGIINQLLTDLGLPTSTFFSAASTAMPTLLFLSLWTIGSGMIIWLSAFKNIDPSLYEAAEMDGAGKIRRFLTVTIPMSTPMIFYNLILGVIGGLQMFNTLLLVDQGKGPEESIYLMAVKIYNEAFRNFRLGYASAIGWVFFLFIGFLTYVMFKTNKWVYLGE